MVLTFEISSDGEGLDISFDAEGRDELIERLSQCVLFGDHSHLMSGDAGVPGFLVTTNTFTEGGKAIPFVTLGMPMQLIGESRTGDCG